MLFSSKAHNLNHIKEKYEKLSAQIDSLPVDRIKYLYNGLKDNFIENYQVGMDKYAIPKYLEQEFLYDNPNAKHLPIYSSGYSNFKLKSIVFNNDTFKYYFTEDLKL